MASAYDKELRRIKLGQWLLLAILLCWYPLMVVAHRFLTAVGCDGEAIDGPIFCVGTACVFLAALAQCRPRCPRCAERFFGYGWRWNPFATQCVHCRLLFSAEGRLTHDELLRLEGWLSSDPPRGEIPLDVPIGCPCCNYRLSGLTTDVCPECGSPFTVDELVDKAAGLRIRGSSRAESRRRDR